MYRVPDFGKMMGMSETEQAASQLVSLIEFLESKGLVLPEEIFLRTFPLGIDGTNFFDKDGKKEDALWGVEDSKDSKINVAAMSKKLRDLMGGVTGDMEDSLTAAHNHDCDNCGLKSNCPIEDHMREIKKAEAATPKVEVPKYKSPKDIN